MAPDESHAGTAVAGVEPVDYGFFSVGPVPVELLLLVLLAGTALVILRARQLFPAAMMTGIFSLLCAGLFTLMDAVDVAFTEAAVGAGVSTVFFLGALSKMEPAERQGPFRLWPLLAVLVTGAALVYGTADMPHYGDPNGPIHAHVAPEYVQGAHELHIPNVVTVVLASYRGYDTLGETLVVLTAGIGVVMLLGGGRRRRDEAEETFRSGTEVGSRRYRMRIREMLVLQVGARMLVPFILLFAFYVQFHGDFGPGGGFQAGVIFAAGLVLYGLVFGVAQVEAVTSRVACEVTMALGALIYAGVGVTTLALGHSFLDYNAFGDHGQHWGILAVEAGVGLAVASTMIRLFLAFASLRPDEEFAEGEEP